MTQTSRLRALLIWSLVCTNIVVLALASYSLYRSRQQYESRAEILTQNVAYAAERHVSNNIEKIDLALRTVVDELERQVADKGIDEKAMGAFLALHELRLPEVEALRVVNAEGLVILGDVSGKENHAKWAERDYFSYHRDHANGSLQIAKPLLDHFTNLNVIEFTRRYNNKDGSFAGVIAASVIVDNLALLLSGFDLGPNGTIYLRNADLGLITRFPPIPNQPAGRIGNSLVSQEGRLLIGSGVHAATYKTAAADGFERIYSFHRIENAAMIVNAGMAREDYLLGWSFEVYKTCAVVFVILLLSLLSVRLLLRLLNRIVRENTRNRIYLQCASDGIQIVNTIESRIVEINDRLCEMLGYARNELFEMRLNECVVGWPPDVLTEDVLPKRVASATPSTMETQLRRKDGTLIDVEVNISSFHLDDIKHLYASYRDIGERKQAEEKIQSLAYFDPLTKLPNRRLLIDRLGHALIASDRSLEYGAMMILDLDNFKAINDTRGHDVGDHLLTEVARLIVGCVRKEDTVSRLGGDEYVVLIESLGQNEASASTQAELIAEKVRNSLSQASLISSDGQPYHSTASIGITLFLGQTQSTDELLKQADVALYQAKGAGRDAIRFFNSTMQEIIEARSVMESALRDGLEKSEFHLFYQPQIDYQQRLTGAEALLRWLPIGKAPVSPMEFIPLAEDTGLIIPIGLWVMQTACAQLCAWSQDPVARNLQIAINVSARQFRQPDFVEQVRKSLEHFGANPSLLKLELTESVVLENVEEIIERMLQIKALGVTFSLDDFGTGFSSLSYLKRLPLDQLKIDQSFVRDITSDPNDAAIVSAIIAMSNSLGMEVIAEGVETKDQLDFLNSSGCRNYQGYLFSRPLPLDEFELFAKRILVPQTLE